jgi:3-keto-5-aminohexanoate cleavage enzyme
MVSFRASAVAARALARAESPEAASPAILTCAVSGGLVTGNPNQPFDRPSVIEAAIGAAEAGAAVVHIHARGERGEMSYATEDYLAIKQGVHARVGEVLLNFSTGAEPGAGFHEREAALLAKPDLASLNCGSVNIGVGDVVLMNPHSLIEQLDARMQHLDVVPEYECVDIGMAATAARLASGRAGSRGMMHLILGIVGGAPANVATISLFKDLVPAGLPWAVTAVGQHNFPMMAVTLALGGHVRTGLEDVVHIAPSEHAESNAQLVARARTLIEAVGRPLATPAQAREILGIGADRARDEHGRRAPHVAAPRRPAAGMPLSRAQARGTQ